MTHKNFQKFNSRVIKSKFRRTERMPLRSLIFYFFWPSDGPIGTKNDPYESKMAFYTFLMSKMTQKSIFSYIYSKMKKIIIAILTPPPLFEPPPGHADTF